MPGEGSQGADARRDRPGMKSSALSMVPVTPSGF